MSITYSENFNHSLLRLAELNRKATTTQDMGTTLLSMSELACDITTCEHSFVLVIEHDTGLLKIVSGPLHIKDLFSTVRIPTDSSIAGAVYNTGQKIVVQNSQSDQRLKVEIEDNLGIRVRNLVAMPLIFRGETIGVLEVINKQEGSKFSKEDLILLETLAAQISMSIMSDLLFYEVKSAFAQVDELERLKSNFIAITSHELRTPLGLILGHATYLNETTKDDAVKQQVDVIIRSANRLREIIEDLSKVTNYQSKTSYIRTRLISMNELVRKVVDENMDLASDKKIALRAILPDTNILVEGDEEKLELAVNNLINNALTFSDSNGIVTVRLESANGQAQVEVEDNGIGIPSADLPRIFERFFQVQSHLTRRHGGMGLGLTVAKAMVELHKGQILAESVEGQGSRFIILVPQSHANTAPET